MLTDLRIEQNGMNGHNGEGDENDEDSDGDTTLQLRFVPADTSICEWGRWNITSMTQ